MSTWIAWAPEELDHKLPDIDWRTDPLERFQGGIQTESCPVCGFTISFISDTDQFQDWNDHFHAVMKGILEVQRRIGDCPGHPKPNWMA